MKRDKPPEKGSKLLAADCIGFELPPKEAANLLRGSPIQPTIKNKHPRIAALVLFDGYKKTTFNSGVFAPLCGGLIPTAECVNGEARITVCLSKVNTMQSPLA